MKDNVYVCVCIYYCIIIFINCVQEAQSFFFFLQLISFVMVLEMISNFL